MALSDEIREKIRTDILAGDLPAGARLTMDGLATRYATSHMPVREAMRELYGEGIILNEPGHGTRVRSVDTRFVDNLLSVRASIDIHLAKLAAAKATRPDIEELENIQSTLEQAVAQADHPAALKANRKFHSMMNTIADNPEAMAIIDRHWLLLAALWRRYGYAPNRFAGVINDHRHLIVALSKNDPEAAGLLMGAHVMKSRHDLIAQMLAAESGTRGGTGTTGGVAASRRRGAREVTG